MFPFQYPEPYVHSFKEKKEDSLLNKSSYSCSFEGVRKASLNIEGLREYAICIISQKKMHKDPLQFNENFIFKITMGEKQKTKQDSALPEHYSIFGLNFKKEI